MELLTLNLPLFFSLLVGHALGDGPLQPGRLSRAKRKGGDPELPWWMALPAHAGIHGAAVFMITGSFKLCIAEMVCHFTIDKLKCLNIIGMKTDQGLHVACKLVWFLIVVYAL